MKRKQLESLLVNLPTYSLTAHYSPDVDGEFSTEFIGSETSNDGADERTTRTEGCDQFFLVGRRGSVVEIVSEVDQNGRDDAGIVTEEGASKGRGNGHQPDESTRLDVFDRLVRLVIVDLGMRSIWKDHGKVGAVETLPADRGA